MDRGRRTILRTILYGPILFGVLYVLISLPCRFGGGAGKCASLNEFENALMSFNTKNSQLGWFVALVVLVLIGCIGQRGIGSEK